MLKSQNLYNKLLLIIYQPCQSYFAQTFIFFSDNNINIQNNSKKEKYIKMSDNDSDSENHHDTKLTLGELGQQQTNNNLFNFRERSHHSSSSDQDQINDDQIISHNREVQEKVQQSKNQVHSQARVEQKQAQQKIIQENEVKQEKKEEVIKYKQAQFQPPQQQHKAQNIEIKQVKFQQKIIQKVITKDHIIEKVQQKPVQIIKPPKPVASSTPKSNALFNFKQQLSQFFSMGERKQKQPQTTIKTTKKNQKFQLSQNKSPKGNDSMNNSFKNQLKSNVDSNKNKQQQLQYDKQMEDDLANLRKNLTKKKKNSQKQHQKDKLNKTVVPSSKKQLQFDQTPQTRAMELKMILMMAQQKKKQNYQRLKQWDKRRAESLAIHRNMVQILQSQIDKRIKSSIQNLQIYTAFFREKAKQQQKYVVHPVINTKYALQNNSISKNVYINCTVILNALSDENNLKCKKIQDFVQLIKNDILRDSIEAHLLQSQRQLLKVRQKISAYKAALRRCNTETQQKTSELALVFNENPVNMNIQADKDFFSTQLQFLSKAEQQTLIQKKLGEHCLEYFYTAMNEQLKRSIVIRDAMVTFSKALEQCYGIQTDPAQIQQLSKAQQNKLIEQFYSLEQIFDQRCLTVFKNDQHIQPSKTLTIGMFTTFLNKFQFQGFDSRIILLKQYQTFFHPSSISKSTSPTATTQSCYLVITVDKWIHLFLDKQKTAAYTKPDVSIRATLKNLQLRPVKNEIVDIVIKDEKRGSMISYFWQSKNQRIYRVQFGKKDNREQFIDFIRKLRG